MIDIERLKALHQAATAEGWVPGSGYTDFGAHYNGIDGTAGNWSPVVGERDMSQPDIELTCFLRNAVPQIIDMADRFMRYQAALRRCGDLVEKYNYRQNEKVEDVVHVVNRALGEAQS